ncbi:hypothetical protein [Sulfidibacter corallicola]|uniref:Uncharacterized protein n=1 Tax=Sulfidibacter corallicola TaxID=2818388 RepID=A0A8A4THX8_SULCO|nr:hypothetical protein [Sulfidibacter corallicola]QTD49160.1 hypothetical protein J3U87_26540 [Sulfidibacter corallicola]
MAFLILSVQVLAGEPETKPEKAPEKTQEHQTTPAAKAAEKGEANAAASGGYVVQLDAARGTPVEDPVLSPDIQAGLAELINTSTEGLVEQRHPNGTVTVDLQGRFQSAMVATIGKDGKVVARCYSKDPEHRCALNHSEPAPPKPEDSKKKP